MAKKAGKSSAPSSPAKQQLAPVDAEALEALKAEGNQLFATKDYEKALEVYDRALRLAGPATADAALLHSNKAACHMMFKKYKEAVNECTVALDTQPTFFKALVRRAKAYEQMGLFKQALSDFQRANKLDTATTETREAEKRLKDIVTGKRGGAANGAGAISSRKAVPTKSPASSRQVAFPAKLSLDDDTRFLHLVPGVTYLELLEHVKQLYPSAGPFALKFLDKEGDLVTIASRNDLQRAMQEAVEAAQKGAGPRLPVTQNSLPPIRLQVVRVASEEEVPKVPEEETAYMQHMLAQLQKVQAAQAAAAGEAEAQAGAQDAQQQQIQIDEWILTFVDLLKEHCGLDPDRPIECNEVGTEKLNAAFTEMMEEDPKADELLGQAYEKFEDQVCLGMYNQATVHQARAELITSKAAKAGTPAADIVADVEKHLKLAEAKFDEALAYKASFLDGYLGKSHLAQLRAKLAANYLVEASKPREDIKDKEERQKAEEAATKEAVKRAFARVTADLAKAAEPFFEASYGLIEKAMGAMSEEEKAKEIKPMKPTAEQNPGDPDNEVLLKSTLLITLGNANYEHSIVRAAGGLEWRPLVEKAAAKFREAGAHEVDIRNALKGHPLAEELADLIGPEPEAPKPEGAAAAAAEPEAPKGLPSLGPKPKKKEGEAAKA